MAANQRSAAALNGATEIGANRHGNAVRGNAGAGGNPARGIGTYASYAHIFLKQCELPVGAEYPPPLYVPGNPTVMRRTASADWDFAPPPFRRISLFQGFP